MMGYVDIVSLVFLILGGIMSLCLIHYAVFFIVGIFAKKKFPETEEKCRYGVIISARNEEVVIGKLIDSIRECDYPADKVDIFVVAHNCTDKTAQVCRDKGVIVYEYDNPDERTLGYAYRYLFKQIDRDYGITSYDGYLVMNADNTVTKNYLSKMNDAFVANGKQMVLTSFRSTKNFNENYMTVLYGMFFATISRLEQRGRTVLGCSTRISGTGWLIDSHLLVNGWEYVCITEDWEFSADTIACGNKVIYCDEAVFYDEQPTTVKIMWRQRLRWAKGHMDTFFTKFKKVVSSIFHPKKYCDTGAKNTFSKYDIGVAIMPLGVMGVSLMLLQVIALAFSPLFGYNIGEVYKNFFLNFAYMSAGSYAFVMLSGVFILLLEIKRLGRASFFKGLFAIIIWPVFMFIAVIMDVMALFIKKLEWKPIPHHYNDDGTNGKGKKKKNRKIVEEAVAESAAVEEVAAAEEVAVDAVESAAAEEVLEEAAEEVTAEESEVHEEGNE